MLFNPIQKEHLNVWTWNINCIKKKIHLVNQYY